MKRRITIVIDVTQAKEEDLIAPSGSVKPNTRVWHFSKGNMVDYLLHDHTNISKLKKCVANGEVYVETSKNRTCEMKV